MNDAMLRQYPLAELRADYSASLRHRAAAAIELSALAFVCPGIHDTVHGSATFLRWRRWTDEARTLKSRIDELEQQIGSGDARVPAGPVRSCAGRVT